jgi:hypothetical protein
MQISEDSLYKEVWFINAALPHHTLAAQLRGGAMHCLNVFNKLFFMFRCKCNSESYVMKSAFF